MAEVELYHGTSLAAALSIKRDGFNPNLAGRSNPTGAGQSALGPGIYGSTALTKAMSFAKEKQFGVILHLKVNLGNCYEVKGNTDLMMKTWASHGFDSAHAKAGIIDCLEPGDFSEEYCIANPKDRVRILRVILINTEEAKRQGFNTDELLMMGEDQQGGAAPPHGTSTTDRKRKRDSTTAPGWQGGTVVQRKDGERLTKLRKEATYDRSAHIMADYCVANGEEVNVIQAEGPFTWVRAQDGSEGYIQTIFLNPTGRTPTGNRILRVQRNDSVQYTIPRKTPTDKSTDDVWVDGQPMIYNNTQVEEIESNGQFSWVWALDGSNIEGYIQSKHLHSTV